MIRPNSDTSMHLKNNHNREGLFKSVGMATAILVMHVLLLAGVILLVMFFGGLVRYLFWILLGGLLLITFSGYLFYRRMRKQGRSLRDALRSPEFNGRSVEISFLGGMASFRLGPPTTSRPLIDSASGPWDEPLKLEDPEAIRLRDIEALSQLLEKHLITPEEYAAAKRRFFEK
jgi:predicted membrane metal-binding protein